MSGWTARKIGETWVVHNEDAQLIADVKTNEKDARVLAAARTLLDACEVALKGHGRVHEDSCPIGPHSDVCTCHVKLLEAAVNKAKGG